MIDACAKHGDMENDNSKSIAGAKFGDCLDANQKSKVRAATLDTWSKSGHVVACASLGLDA